MGIIEKSLVTFGKESGLFTDISVKKHGRSMSDPFQLKIKNNGPKVNLIDTGYGISQILPILARIFNAKRNTSFLLQQPEVHLHPRAQAALSSLFGQVIQKGHLFIIETHSDYMIDRLKIEIRKGSIKCDDVSLICLESVQGGVKAHNITFDKEGNMQNVPRGYRNSSWKKQTGLLGLIDE